MEKQTIGVLGLGVVGYAVLKGLDHPSLKDEYDIIGYDLDPKKNVTKHTFKDLLNSAFIFVCVQTPTDEHGFQDLTFLGKALDELVHFNFHGIVVVKSTILPGTMDKFQRQYPSLRLVHSPEFLTEKNAFADFSCPKHPQFVSGPLVNRIPVMKLLDQRFGMPEWVQTRAYPPDPSVMGYDDFKVTEAIKYFHNCFCAIKVTFANEFAQYCREENINYETVANAASLMPNVGKNHLMVPGPDGLYGYGGMCFPKDMAAIQRHFSFSHGLIKTAQELNSIYRSLRPLPAPGPKTEVVDDLDLESHLYKFDTQHEGC